MLEGERTLEPDRHTVALLSAAVADVELSLITPCMHRSRVQLETLKMPVFWSASEPN